MIFELLVIIVHNPPGVNYTFQFRQIGKQMRYSFDTLCTCFMMFRFYFVFRLFTQFTKWRDEHSQRCCEVEGIEADTIFALKSLLIEKPYTVLAICFIFSSTLLGLTVRLLELPYYEDETTEQITVDMDGYQDYNFIWNGIWLIVVTMTTVGFGDYFPKTHLGRFVIIIASFWGVFLVSLMVVTLTNSSEFSIAEQNSFDIL